MDDKTKNYFDNLAHGGDSDSSDLNEEKVNDNMDEVEVDETTNNTEEEKNSFTNSDSNSATEEEDVEEDKLEDKSEELDEEADIDSEINLDNDDDDGIKAEPAVATLAKIETKPKTKSKSKIKAKTESKSKPKKSYPKTKPSTRTKEVTITEHDDSYEPGDIFLNEAEGQLTVDVFQTSSEIIIQSTIAGVNPEDLHVDITGEQVSIRGERHRTEQINDDDFFYQECYWGKFSRLIILPQEVDPDHSEASLKDGVLTIRLPKLIRDKSKRVKIKLS